MENGVFFYMEKHGIMDLLHHADKQEFIEQIAMIKNTIIGLW